MAAWQLDRQDRRVELVGDLRMHEASAIWRALKAATREPPRDAGLDLDLARTERIDGNVVALLVAERSTLADRGIHAEIVGASGKIAELVHLFGGDQPVHPVAQTARPHLIERLGAATARMLRYLRAETEFLGEVTVAIGRLLRRARLGNWRSLPSLLSRAATDGLLIVLLLNFLVGLVMAYQSSTQLELYGANIFVADVVGISITRELGPLMTAIIICGRSGAAYAAELGTMRVSEEIDALRTLGISPIPYLVVPRIVALAIAAPVLTLLGDVVGVIGGVVVGATTLEVSPAAFLAELRLAIFASDVWTGLIKSTVFGAAIAFIGCQQGLSTSGAASGVGRGTTTTVVFCLFTIVIVDTIFTVLFRVGQV